MAVLNVIQEGEQLYALLDDGRIITKVYEDRRCAEVGAEQTMRLQTPTWQMLQWFGWEVQEEAPE